MDRIKVIITSVRIFARLGIIRPLMQIYVRASNAWHHRADAAWRVPYLAKYAARLRCMPLLDGLYVCDDLCSSQLNLGPSSTTDT
jgi:hypothetical protein